MPVGRIDKEKVLIIKDVGSLIITIRNQKVIIDRDLAEIYGVETRRLNEQVKRNPDRFPEDFMFQLTKEERRFNKWVPQSVAVFAGWGLEGFWRRFEG